MKIRSMVYCLSTLALVTASAVAKDSTFRRAVGVRSEAVGVATSLKLYTRVSGPGRASRIEQLLPRLSSLRSVSGQPVSTTESGESVMVHGPGWLLDIRGDGNAVRFDADSYRHRAGIPGVEVDHRMSEGHLSDLGSEFISGFLRDQIPLGSGEHLELWRTAYEIESVTEIGGATQTQVVANRVVFTRVIDNIPVLGPGSKIALTFANDGQIIGFQYDWSVFSDAGEVRENTDVGVLKGRATALLEAKAGPGKTEPRRFECGYYDAGARVSATGSPLQGGCIAEHAVARNGTMQVLIAAVPAAQNVISDPAWLETSAYKHLWMLP